jgi:hypothetical protein
MRQISLRSQIISNRGNCDLWLNESLEVYGTPPESPIKSVTNQRSYWEYSAFKGLTPQTKSNPSTIIS